jgi:hypothetical protein
MIRQLKQIGDLNFEWIAGYMLYHGIIPSMENIGVKSLGIFNRYVSNEIENIKKQHKDTILEINREGIYDALPHGLFHVTKTYDSYQMPVHLIKEEIKKEKEKELEARKFFRPFEEELYKMQVVAELYARDVISGFYGASRKDFEDLIPFDISCFSEEERVRILLILPVLRQLMKMQAEEMGSWILQFVLNQNVSSVSVRKNTYRRAKDSDIYLLGNTFLGWDCTLGSVALSEESILQVELTHNGSGDEALEFYLDKELDNKAEILLKWILPLHVSFEITKTFQTIPSELNKNMIGMQLGMDNVNKKKDSNI